MVKILTLKRVTQNDSGTFGVLIENTTPFALTLENPWRENRRNYSCIPAGSYWCKRIQSPKFGNTFEILEVPERSEILFHPGNTRADTFGCILVGEQFEYLHGEPAILQSRKGFDEFMKSLEGHNEFVINIIWV